MSGTPGIAAARGTTLVASLEKTGIMKRKEPNVHIQEEGGTGKTR